MDNEKSKIVYVGTLAMESLGGSDEPLEPILEDILSEFNSHCQQSLTDSAKEAGSYKFTLIIERMELPCTVEDWQKHHRIIIRNENEY